MRFLRVNQWCRCSNNLGFFQGPMSTRSHVSRTMIVISESLDQLPSRTVDIDESISKYCLQGHIQEAILLMSEAVKQHVWHSMKLYSQLLKACIQSASFIDGKKVHDLIIRSGYHTNIFLQNTLVDMYAKCGSLLDACYMFNMMDHHNLFSYTAIISAYIEHGEYKKSIQLFELMISAGLQPDKHVYTLVFKCCATLPHLEWGRVAHFSFSDFGLQHDVFVDSTLIDMYVKCNALCDACQQFDAAKVRDVIVWTSVIAGYAQHGDNEMALQFFNRMEEESVKPNNVTCLSVLKACSSLAATNNGKQIHTFIVANDMEFDKLLGNTLIDMYAKCDRIGDARHVFDRLTSRDIVSWNVLIMGYVKQGHFREAISLFNEVLKCGFVADKVTFVGALKGCSQLSSPDMGKLVHSWIIESSCKLDCVLQSALVDMYIKCGSIEDGRKIFDKMEKRDVVCWTSLLDGYAKEGLGKEAIDLFDQMKQEGVKPDEVAFISALKACTIIGALHHGKQIHDYVKSYSLQSKLRVRNALVDMYAKCGNLEDAHEVFVSDGECDVISWNTIISGYAQQGFGKKAIQLFEQMLALHEKPDETTYLSVLTACRHAGLVEQGRHYFDSMSQDHGISPTMDHYACMVDLLCRVGCEDQAEAFILKMEIEPDVIVWMSLLGGCRCRGNVEIGKRAFEHIKSLNPNIFGAYVLLSNIFANAGMWEDVAKVRQEMDLLSVKKESGCSWIEVAGGVHSFKDADDSHPELNAIRSELKRLSSVMKEAGYRPNLSFNLHMTECDDKESKLCEHSEKLAIAFGLIKSPPGMPIRVMKNLRLCGDCHSAFKTISKIENREIFARDANRFHHIRFGVCSCGDYW